MIIRPCTFDGCTVMTIGSRCVEHDVPVTRSFVRGRPFLNATSTRSALARVTQPYIVTTSLVPYRRTADAFARP